MTTQREDVPRWLRERCAGNRRHLLARALVSEAELDEVEPDDDSSLRYWVEYYGQLRAWLWVQDDTPTKRDEAEEKVLKALREAPEVVTLSDDRRVNVYPKSLDALLWFRDTDHFVRRLNRRVNEVLLRLDTAPDSLPDEIVRGPAEAMAATSRELAYQLALMAAVAIEPGATLPKWATSEERPPVPAISRRLWFWRRRAQHNPIARTLRFDPVDLIALNQKFREVNAGRLGALQYVLPPKKLTESRATHAFSFDVMIGQIAMKTGADPEYLTKERSLVSLISQVELAAPVIDPLDELG